MTCLHHSIPRWLLVAAALLSGPGLLLAQPPLTTIRDTVYRADGSPFNGIALIQWRTFQASNSANIGTQSTTVRVVNGNLYVRLTPTTSTTGAYYQVRYNSDGLFQFTEFWAVPPSTAALKLRDIRATLLPGGVIVGGGNGGGVIGDVTGSVTFVDSYNPPEVPDGARRRFTLNPAPDPSTSLVVFRNGVYQTLGLDYTYISTSAEIEFLVASTPQSGDLIEVFYRVGGSTAGGGGSSGGSTGLSENSIPFAGSGGVLSQNVDRLVWFNNDRRMSVGNNASNSTQHVYDSSAGAVTQLNVRAGAGQGSTPMQFWFNNANTPVAWVNADGSITARGLLSNTTSLRAGIGDDGVAADPATQFLQNGNLWHNTTTAARKSFEGSQVHSLPQTVCSTTGTSTTSTTLTALGTCTLARDLVLAGDRYEIHATYTKSGTAGADVEILLGGTPLMSRTAAGTDAVTGGTVTLALGTDVAAWNAMVIAASGTTTGVGQASFVPGLANLVLQFRGRLTSAGSDTVRLVNFSVVRYPNQTNP